MKVQPYFLHRGTVCPCSADYGGMDAELLLRPIGNLLIKVFCGVGKRGKDQYLFVARIDRDFNLPGIWKVNWKPIQKDRIVNGRFKVEKAQVCSLIDSSFPVWYEARLPLAQGLGKTQATDA